MSPREICERVEDVAHSRWPADAYVRVAGDTSFFTSADGSRSSLGDVVEPGDQDYRVQLIWDEGKRWPTSASPSYAGRLLGGGGKALGPSDPDYAAAPTIYDHHGVPGRIRLILEVDADRLGKYGWLGPSLIAVGAIGVVLLLRIHLATWRNGRAES